MLGEKNKGSGSKSKKREKGGKETHITQVPRQPRILIQHLLLQRRQRLRPGRRAPTTALRRRASREILTASHLCSSSLPTNSSFLLFLRLRSLLYLQPLFLFLSFLRFPSFVPSIPHQLPFVLRLALSLVPQILWKSLSRRSSQDPSNVRNQPASKYSDMRKTFPISGLVCLLPN